MLFVATKYLSQNNYNYLLGEFKENFYSHPNYPSLFAITDSLTLLQIENIAVQLPKDKLESLPNNFIAKTSLDNKFVLVKKQKDSIQYETELGEKHVVPFEKFRNIWSGVIVAIEENKNTHRTSQAQNKGLVLFGTVIGLIFLLSFFSSTFDFSSFIFKIISLLGLFFGFFILQEKYEGKNEIVSKICNLNASTSCDSVIKSNTGFIKGIDFSDLPILFFSLSFMAISLGVGYLPYIGLISLLSVPIIIYSIYLQAVKLKKWCVLCLSVSLLLLFEASYFVLGLSSFDFAFYSLLKFAIIASLIIFGWYFVKSILVKNNEATTKNNELLRFKRNFELFKFLAKPIKEKEALDVLNPIVLGNKEAPLKLSLFLSPSCGHCHTAYKNAMDLIVKYPTKIKLEVYYNLNIANLDNPYTQIAKNTLQIGHSSNHAKEALDDWHIEKMELKEWLEKWKQPKIDDKTENSLERQYDWCNLNEFHFTPVKLINGRLFPDGYEVGELRYFLNDLIEEYENESDSKEKKEQEQISTY